MFSTSQEVRKNLFTTVVVEPSGTFVLSFAVSTGNVKKTTSPLEQTAAHRMSSTKSAAPEKQLWFIRDRADEMPKILVPTRLLIGPFDTLQTRKCPILTFIQQHYIQNIVAEETAFLPVKVLLIL